MKEIFRFEAFRDKEVEVKTQTADGVLTKTEVQKQPVNIIIKSPSILEKEWLDEFQAVEWSKLVMSGVLTKQMLLKIYSDSGGILSKDDTKRYIDLIEKYNTALLNYQEINSLKGKKKDQQENLKVVTEELEKLYQEIQSFDSAREDLFKNSVESKVQDRSIQWLSLFLGYIEDGKDLTPVCTGETYQDKLKSFYSIKNSDDAFLNLVLDKIAFYVSLWYLGRVTTKEDFQRLEASLNE